MTYADKLRVACKWRKLTQAELARRSGLSLRTIQKYMAGETVPNMKNLIKINEVIGLPLDYYFSEDLSYIEEDGFMETFEKMRDFIMQSRHENTIREQPSFSFMFDEGEFEE